MKQSTIIKNNILIAQFMHIEVHTDGIGYFDSNFNALPKYNEDLSELYKVFEQMHCGLRVCYYNYWNDIDYADLIIHNSHTAFNRYVTFKIEYGRRFKEWTEYKKDNEDNIKPLYRLVVNFIKWYNQHQNIE